MSLDMYRCNKLNNDNNNNNNNNKLYSSVV